MSFVKLLCFASSLLLCSSLMASDEVDAVLNSFTYRGGNKSVGSMDVESIFIKIKGIEFETSKKNCTNCTQGMFDSKIHVRDDHLQIKGLFSLKIPVGKKNYLKGLNIAKMGESTFTLKKNKIDLKTNFFRFDYGKIDFRLAKSHLSCLGKNKNAHLDLDYMMDSCFNQMSMAHSNHSTQFTSILNYKGRDYFHLSGAFNSLFLDSEKLRVDLAKAMMLFRNRYQVELEASSVYCKKGESISSFVSTCTDSLVMTGDKAKAFNREADHAFKLELVKYRAQKNRDDVSFKFRKFVMPVGFMGDFSVLIDGFYGKCFNFDLDNGFDKSCFDRSSGSLWNVQTQFYNSGQNHINASFKSHSLSWSFLPEAKSIAFEFAELKFSNQQLISMKSLASRLKGDRLTLENFTEGLTFNDHFFLSLDSLLVAKPWIDEQNTDKNIILTVKKLEKAEDRALLDIPFVLLTSAKKTTGLWGIKSDCLFYDSKISSIQMAQGCLEDGVLELDQVFDHGREYKENNYSLNIHRNARKLFENENYNFLRDKLSFEKLHAKKMKLVFEEQRYKLTGKFTLFDRLLPFEMSGETSLKSMNDGRLEICFDVAHSNLPVIGKYSRWPLLKVVALLFNVDGNDSLVVDSKRKKIYLRI